MVIMWNNAKNARTFAGSQKNNLLLYILWFILGGFVIWLIWQLIANVAPAIGLKIETEAEKQVEKAKGYELTYSKSYYKSSADSIYESLRYSSLDDNADRAEEILKLTVKNPLDWIELIASYGVRQRYVFGLKDGSPQSLLPTLRGEFSQTRIERVNNYLSSINVKNLI